MKWKNIFSLPTRKKVHKKLLAQLQQSGSPIDATQVTGGVSSGPGQQDVGWIKSEIADGLK